MTRIRRTAAAAALALLLPLPIAGMASATPSATASVAAAHTAPNVFASPELPRPTGPHAVGRDILHLVDQDRPDPWVPSAGPRQLMVSMYYPAHPGTGGPAPYMTTEEARLFLKAKNAESFPPELLTGTRTWAHTDARPEHGRFPLVVLSPGMTLPRATLTGLAEDLASRGYVVALVDHTYEAAGITFPDGQTIPCGQVCDTPPAGGPGEVSQSRAKDVSFVLDELTGRHPAWRYARMIDPNRIGMAGHSIGGDAASVAMADDDRIRAGVNMDGSFWAPDPATGLHGRPFLLLGEQEDHPAGGGDTSWDKAWANLDGWKRWLAVTGADHGSFTDMDVLAAAAGKPTPNGIPPHRSEEITRSYVAAFFDLQLKGIPQPLLDGPSPANPEVTFQHP
ncbi:MULTISPECIES: alpha/beta hydrolase family protein [Kitasatospora]|uniref:Lipase n=1 Tax=Kitasatospora cystarginea TaxID=58350 RepID=A0ABP5R193_9ACTN